MPGKLYESRMILTAFVRSWRKDLRLLQLAFSLILLSAHPAQDAIAQSDSTEVVVDVRNAYRINGHDQVQSNDFGLTAYQGATRPVTPTGAAIIRQAGLTVIGFPGIIQWCAPQKNLPTAQRVSPDGMPRKKRNG